MHPDHTVTVEEAVQVLAMVGDLSMGQPTDQSIRTAILAERLALQDGAPAGACAHVRLVTLLRWSGCTANASGFTALLGDDVAGRDAMLTQTLPQGTRMSFTSVAPLARIHCEVSGAIAQAMGLPIEVETGLRRVWEHYDGGGMPERLTDADIPRLVYYTNLASDLEVLARAHGIEEALRMIGARADKTYPAALARLLAAHAGAWLAALEAPPCPAQVPALRERVPLSIVADMIELKLPWLLGYSRRVAGLAERAAALAGLPEAQQACLGRAALIHGIGRAAVPNAVWQRPGKLGGADWEKVRLVPYWTARAGVQIPSLRLEATLASHAYERLDGSGYHRDLDAGTLTMAQRILGAASAYAALRMPRPWRVACEASEAARILAQEAAAGRFDVQAVEMVAAAAEGSAYEAARPVAQHRKLLSERETAVLRRLSLGESNKEVARALGISPSTVRTHVESIFRKLECSTRTAATLKGLTLGLI
ncbi:LuxR C-terminal-related transcriptional regulator [Massilia sp. G4R7]|uniref:LuxR C-terminal-related transcriptional regulator n=1 Tax=Massilia phyllostachyos TaxID=2898585 RepID=A0ABS8QBM1_9BURK|nr:HD domain-containing phosphohydrolase [Massilia phyllostachyos]MCD2519163.1 LuxR C-terminal-related transcriptional regulator [Massilia phyllostachyos]